MVPEEWPRSPHQSSRKHLLLRLAEAEQLLLIHSRLPPRVLRVQKAVSQCSELSSSAKGLTPHHLTSQRLGAITSWQLIYWTSTQAFQTAFVLVLTQVFHPYPRPLPPLITHLLLSILLNLIPLFRLSFRKSAMWAQLPRRKWSSLLGPSRPPRSVSYLNQGNLGNSELFKTCLYHIPPLIPSHPSTAQLTQVSTPAHGVLSQLSASSYGASPQNCRLQYAMSRKHTGAFQSNPSSGHAWSFAWTKETVS